MGKLKLMKPRETNYTVVCYFKSKTPDSNNMPKVKTKPGQENKLIHPKSRKTDQISREWHRQVRVKNNRKETATKLSILGEKIAWFRDNLPEDLAVMTNTMTAELIEKYLARFDEEVEQIQMKNQIGHRNFRQHASREDSIAHSQQLEKQEFETCGLEIPDVMCSKNLEYLRKWDGSLKFISNISLKRCNKKNLLSLDPPTSSESSETSLPME